MQTPFSSSNVFKEKGLFLYYIPYFLNWTSSGSPTAVFFIKERSNLLILFPLKLIYLTTISPVGILVNLLLKIVMFPDRIINP
jgi:hypothetical protein